MSFSYSKTGFADEVRADIKSHPAQNPASNQVPHSLKEFLLIAIHEVKGKHGANCWVGVSASGHVGGDATNASISVGLADQPKVEEPAPKPTEPEAQ